MGKYALGNPKNNWSDVYRNIEPGTFIVLHWQDDTADLVARKVARINAYEVLDKRVLFADSTGVEWRLRDIVTDEVRERVLLNLSYDRHQGYACAISKEQADEYRADPLGSTLPTPSPKPIPLYADYAYEFDTQGGKYPRPAKPKPYDEPEAGTRWQARFTYEPSAPFRMTVQGIELWGVGRPRAVAFLRDGSSTVERRTVEYFKHNYQKL